MRLDEQPKDDANVVHVQEVQVAGTNEIHVADERTVSDAVPIADEVVVTNVEVVDEMIVTNVELVAIYLVLIAGDDTATIDVTEVMIPTSTKSFVHTEETLLGGPSNRSVFTEYADHVAYRLWQGNVYIICLTSI